MRSALRINMPPKLIKWRRGVSGRDQDARDAALTEIREIDQADAIPSMEEVTLGRDARDSAMLTNAGRFASHFCRHWKRFPDRRRLLRCARHAVYSPSEEARISAIEKLKTPTSMTTSRCY